MYVKTTVNIISTVKYARYSTLPCLSLPPLAVRCPQGAGTFLGFQQGEERTAEAPAHRQPGSTLNSPSISSL